MHCHNFIAFSSSSSFSLLSSALLQFSSLTSQLWLIFVSSGSSFSASLSISSFLPFFFSFSFFLSFSNCFCFSLKFLRSSSLLFSLFLQLFLCFFFLLSQTAFFFSLLAFYSFLLLFSLSALLFLRASSFKTESLVRHLAVLVVLRPHVLRLDLGIISISLSWLFHYLLFHLIQKPQSANVTSLPKAAES